MRGWPTLELTAQAGRLAARSSVGTVVAILTIPAGARKVISDIGPIAGQPLRLVNGLPDERGAVMDIALVSTDIGRVILDIREIADMAVG